MTKLLLFWHKDKTPRYSIQSIVSISAWPEGKTAEDCVRDGLEVQANWYPNGCSMIKGHKGTYPAKIILLSGELNIILSTYLYPQVALK